MARKPLISLLALASLFAAGGASCPRMLQQYTVQQAPVVFEGLPERDRAIAVVNANTACVEQFQTTGATLKVPGVPALRASLCFQRPRRLRLIADTSITGVELDLGSNDELFWMWVKRNNPPAVYFCRHDEFHASGVREVIPIEPTWLAEALGVVHFDPRGYHEGPYQAGRGRMEMRSKFPMPEGEFTKVTVLDDARGWVLEQHILDHTGRRIASAAASHHKYDAKTGVTLPRHVEIQLPTIEMAFTLDVSDYIINRVSGDPATLWTMPRRSEVPPVNLGGIGRDGARLLPPIDVQTGQP